MMARPSDAGPIEFIRLAGHAVRVTSLRDDPETGGITIVTIVRGARDAEVLRELLAGSPLVLELPDEDGVPVSVAALDLRETGEGPTRISRFAMTLVPQNALDDPPPMSLEERVASLEEQVQALTAQVKAFLRRE